MERLLSGNVSIELLIGYIEGELTESQGEEIKLWLTESRNRAFFNTFKDAWTHSHELKELTRDNQEKDWKLITDIIRDREKESRRLVPFYPNKWMRVAAIVLMLISIPGGYYLGRESNPSQSLKGGGYHEIMVPQGEKSELILSDGTKVWINAGSTIRFPNQFNGSSRDIWLDGEAYFEVTRDTLKPFLVHTSDLDVRVHGTKFNVKAYEEDDIIEATLIEGLVSLETRNMMNRKIEEVFLQPNHKAIYLKRKKTIIPDDIVREIEKPLQTQKITITKAIKVEPAISWREGKLVFVDESFDVIAEKLERRFGVQIRIETDRIKKIRYTGVLKNISIEQALRAIQLTTKFSFTINENVITISDGEFPVK